MKKLEGEPLHLLSKEEMWDLCRKVKPTITWADFEEKWFEYWKIKRNKGLQ